MSGGETITREELAAYGERNRYVDDWAGRVLYDVQAHRESVNGEDRRALLGQRVRVKLDEHVVQEGKLLGFDEGGEIQLEGDDGFVWYGWPALEVAPVTA